MKVIRLLLSFTLVFLIITHYWCLRQVLNSYFLKPEPHSSAWLQAFSFVLSSFSFNLPFKHPVSLLYCYIIIYIILSCLTLLLWFLAISLSLSSWLPQTLTSWNPDLMNAPHNLTLLLFSQHTVSTTFSFIVSFIIPALNPHLSYTSIYFLNVKI